MTSMVNSTLNKRKYNTPYMPRKKARVSRKEVIYRTVKPEMKHIAFPIVHAATFNSTLDCSAIAQGTTNLSRIGNKIHVWNIQALFAFNQSIRVDFLLPTDQSGTAPSYGYNTPEDRDEFTNLGTYILNPQNGGNTQMGTVSKKLPMGFITKYTGSAANTCNKNGLFVRITAPVSATVNGYVQLWYTDA